VTFKDLFAEKAGDYARFRPTYPDALLLHLASQVPARSLAVDVGTGNGQVALALADHFERVVGLDPSEGQLASARPHPRVEYRQARAEATGLAGSSADLLTAGQAFHWFEQEAFFGEVRRVVRPGGALAVWCYPLMAITPEVDRLVFELYHDYLGPYWEPERRLVEDGYAKVSFPFEEIAAPPFEMQLGWSFEHLIGYISTWSPLKRYRRERGRDPVALMEPSLRGAWGDTAERPVTWPLSLRVFRV
jgi:SAM-dependent methyltransferase